MVKIIINKKETFNLRIDYDNITFGEFLELRKLNNIENRTNAQIAILANMKLEKVNRLSPFAIEKLKPFLEFLEDTETLKCKELSEDIANIKIGDETWHKIEQVKMLLKDTEPLDIADKIVAIYVDIALKNKLMPEAMGIINHFLCEIKDFFAKFVRLNEYKPSNDELMAGVKQLDYLGYVNTLDALAQGNLLNYDGILKTSADTVYTKLLKDFETHEYSKRLNKIKENKR